MVSKYFDPTFVKLIDEYFTNTLVKFWNDLRIDNRCVNKII